MGKVREALKNPYLDRAISEEFGIEYDEEEMARRIEAHDEKIDAKLREIGFLTGDGTTEAITSATKHSPDVDQVGGTTTENRGKL